MFPEVKNIKESIKELLQNYNGKKLENKDIEEGKNINLDIQNKEDTVVFISGGCGLLVQFQIYFLKDMIR